MIITHTTQTSRRTETSDLRACQVTEDGNAVCTSATFTFTFGPNEQIQLMLSPEEVATIHDKLSKTLLPA